jgi:Putative Flp pilus-assembly TadE/G-like
MLMRTVGLVAGPERGAVLPTFALWLPVLALFVVLVVDVANWFEHKRHLQMQADAGALAGGTAFTFPCSDGPIEAITRKYGGDPGASGPYNLQVAPTLPANVHLLVNSDKYWNEGGTNHSDGGPPCSAKRIDVKLTEANLPLFFGAPGLFDLVPAINARARVSIQNLDYLAGGSLPIAVPDIDPSRAEVRFVDESDGTVLASRPLLNTGVANGLAIWDNTAAPLAVPISSSRIGVRVVFSSNATSMTCGDPLVECYDAGSPDGVLYVRGWSSAGSGAQPNPPIARDVGLVPGTCADPYFTSSSTACTVGVSAVVDFGLLDPSLVRAEVRATIGGTTHPLAYDPATQRWRTTGNANFFTVNAGAGPLPVTLDWEERVGTVNGQACSNGNNNPCKGSFGTVQRVFSAVTARSGPVQLAQVWQNGLFWANSFEVGTTQNLVVKIGITPSLKNAQSVNDPIVTLRVVGGSQNQSLDCDPNYSNLYQELAFGCRPSYRPNQGTTCPASASALWATAQPWDCVAVQTGSATNQVPRGLNLRVLGDEKPSVCTSPNNWSQFPNLPPGDPRVLSVFITPFGSFGGSGNAVFPVVKLGSFYVTGWTAQGGGFSNPCQGQGDDPVPNNDAGNIVGHFIKYVFSNSGGGGSGQTCDFNAFGGCIAVLTD